jgi:hypothetical protein
MLKTALAENPKANINATDGTGNTALHYGCVPALSSKFRELWATWGRENLARLMYDEDHGGSEETELRRLLAIPVTVNIDFLCEFYHDSPGRVPVEGIGNCSCSREPGHPW